MAAADQPSTDPSASADPDASTTGSTGEAAEQSAEPDAVKARFREALERKKVQHGDGVGGGGPNSSKIHDVHSKAGAKRQFRRKSGG
jgi:hypothetical protein